MSIYHHFPNLSLTSDQTMALERIEAFLTSDDQVFVLQGYAGSGKTTLIRGLVSYLTQLKNKYQLMAPTGRAAKVLSDKTGYSATTIHRGIYSFDELEEIREEGQEDSFRSYYKIASNPNVYDMVLIVDEASMVSDVESQQEFFRFGSGCLMNDLIQYTRVAQTTTQSKIIFVGDPAQLPPIGMEFSPALDPEYLYEKYNLSVDLAVIKEVKRQKADQGILSAATNIREALTAGHFCNFNLNTHGDDLVHLTYDQFFDAYKNDQEQKIIITHKNKTAQDINRDIRRDKYGDDMPPMEGDLIIVGANNYHFGLMNGEFGVISAANNTTIVRDVNLKTKNGNSMVRLIWRDISLVMPDEGSVPKCVNCLMLENFLSEGAQLDSLVRQALYVDFKMRHQKLIPKTEEFKEALFNDHYFNCVMLKYGYAVTCHKAQGGEWPQAYVIWDYAKSMKYNPLLDKQTHKEHDNAGFFRWAYTAITRASETLFCINPPSFNSFSGMNFVGQAAQETFNELTGAENPWIDIVPDAESEAMLSRFGLNQAEPALQNHFLIARAALADEGIQIVSYKRSGFEIQYGFAREMLQTRLKFWINGKGEFNKKIVLVPGDSQAQALGDAILQRLGNSGRYRIVRDGPSLVEPEAEFMVDEARPFLSALYQSVALLTGQNHIFITRVTHMTYRERYTFVRGLELAVVDFEYNGDGFFGRVLPIRGSANMQALLTDIRTIVQHLKKENYVERSH